MRTQYAYDRRYIVTANDDVVIDPNYGLSLAMKMPTREFFLDLIQRKLTGERDIKFTVEYGVALCKNERFEKSFGRNLATSRIAPRTLELGSVEIQDKSITLFCGEPDEVKPNHFIAIAVPLVGVPDSTRLAEVSLNEGE